MESALARCAIVTAAVCVVLLFVRSAASIIAPIFLALFIAVIATPPLQWMRRRGLPKYLVLLDVGGLVTLTTTSCVGVIARGATATSSWWGASAPLLPSLL